MRSERLFALLLSVAVNDCVSFPSPTALPTKSATPSLLTCSDLAQEISSSGKKLETHDESFIQRNFEQQHDSAFTKSNLTPRVFSLSQVVNHDSIKRALLLAATNPRLGRAGVLIGGGHGTCKSVLARSAIHLLPPELERITGSPFNLEPVTRQIRAAQQPLELDPFLGEQIHNSNDTAICDLDSLLGVELIPMPFATVPLYIGEESLLGSVDIERSMETGRTVFSPGLLAKAHRGILYIDDLHLLEDSIANCLLNALSEGQVVVEREGLSVQYPCRPAMVIATFNPEEGDLSQQLMDRFAMCVSSDAQRLTIEQRVQVVLNVEAHQDQRESHAEAQGFLEDSFSASSVDDNGYRTSVLQARELLQQVHISRDQILYLCQEATRAGCEGQRGEIVATEIAKTIATLQGRTHVIAEDLQQGVFLAIAPRAQLPMQSVAEELETSQPQPQPQPSELEPIADPDPDHIQPNEPKDPDDPPENDAIEEPESADEEPEGSDTGEEEGSMEIPTEFTFGADFDVPIDPNVLHVSRQLAKKGKGGKDSKIFSTTRGRFVKAIFPKSIGNGRLAIGATLRAAAPHQTFRRQHEHAGLPNRRGRSPRVLVTKDDFRIQRLARKAGSLVVFMVDASGSMALNRMGAAKGAAILLLKEAYKSRDKIALVAFHGQRAEVLVPPTKSMSLTRSRLEGLPCGGGSPLAHALEISVRLALNELKVKRDIGHVFLVLLSDGRANVPLSASHDTKSERHQFISSDRKALKEEVIALSRQLSAIPSLDLLCVDTEDQFMGTGIAKDIATAGLGSYQRLLGTADTSSIHQLVRQELRAAKKL